MFIVSELQRVLAAPEERKVAEANPRLQYFAPPEPGPSSECKKAINLFVDGLCKSSKCKQQATKCCPLLLLVKWK